MLFHIAAAAVLTKIAFLEIYTINSLPEITDTQFLSDQVNIDFSYLECALTMLSFDYSNALDFKLSVKKI